MIGKLANLNLGYVKSADLTAKELNIIVTNIYIFLKLNKFFSTMEFILINTFHDHF